MVRPLVVPVSFSPCRRGDREFGSIIISSLPRLLASERSARRVAAYIPDVSAYARQSYQDGIRFLFGTSENCPIQDDPETELDPMQDDPENGRNRVGKPLGNAHQNAECRDSDKFPNHRVFESQRGDRVQRSKPREGEPTGSKKCLSTRKPEARAKNVADCYKLLQNAKNLEIRRPDGFAPFPS